MHNMHISTLFPHNGVLQRGRHNGRRTTGKMMQTAKCPFAKNRHAKNMFCENLVSPRMCLRKSSISRTVVCERSGSDLSQKIFLPMFCEKPPCPKICFAKIWFPQGCVCENPGNPGPWFAKDQGQIFLKRFAIVKLFVATCAHILINEENNIFLRKTCFLKNAGHKSLRLIAKWQLDNIYVEPLVCEEPGPGSSQTGC